MRDSVLQARRSPPCTLSVKLHGLNVDTRKMEGEMEVKVLCMSCVRLVCALVVHTRGRLSKAVVGAQVVL